jgi:RND family efflux transporter MFP subunit
MNAKQPMHQIIGFRVIAQALLWTFALPAIGADTSVPVAVVRPGTSTATQELRLSGTLSAERDASLSPRVDGLVARVLVDAGDTVQTGDILLELDASLAQLALRRAQAQTAQARTSLDETRRLLQEAERLVADQHLPKTELGTRRANVALAEAALRSAQADEADAKERVARHQLPAPFGGVIVRKLTESGEWVTRGTPVLELVATDRVRLDVRSPQERYGALDPDSAVTVLPDAMPGRRFEARIDARVPVSDPTTRTFLVRVVVDNADAGLLPGTSATAVFTLDSGNVQALVVPQDALLRHADGGYSVFALNPEAESPVAQRRKVTLGQQGPHGVEVLSGLSVGEAVVVRGNEILRDGQAVRVVETLE